MSRFIFKTICATLGLVLSSQASAVPSVFLAPEKLSAWYTHKAVVRPMGKTVDGIPLLKLNAYRKQRWPEFSELCYAEGAGKDTYVGLDRATQDEITKQLTDLKHDPFIQRFSTLDGRKLVARVAIQETCDAKQKGAMIIVYDPATTEILDVLEWEDDPFRFLWPARGEGLLAHSSCFECGDWNVGFYDVSRKRFYWEAQGD